MLDGKLIPQREAGGPYRAAGSFPVAYCEVLVTMSAEVAAYPTTLPTNIRDRGVLDNAYSEAISIRSAMARHGDISPELRHVEGILATLAWALGRSTAGPLSQRPPDGDALRAEEQLASDQLEHTPAHEKCERSFLIAVRNTLRWATGATDTPPF